MSCSAPSSVVGYIFDKNENLNPFCSNSCLPPKTIVYMNSPSAQPNCCAAVPDPTKNVRYLPNYKVTRIPIMDKYAYKCAPWYPLPPPPSSPSSSPSSGPSR